MPVFFEYFRCAMEEGNPLKQLLVDLGQRLTTIRGYL
jgi:hypothetical protein